ncbi:MAG: hypothetical protein ABIG44_05550 [Planctomycetota bacterium]
MGENLGEYLWVIGGALLTLGLGAALLYWIDAEWRVLDERQRQARRQTAFPIARPIQPPIPEEHPPDD